MGKPVFKEHFVTVDLETLSKWNNSIILSMGMTFSRYDDKEATFTSLVKNGLYVKFDTKEQHEHYSRIVDRGTLDWWKQQGASAKAVLQPSLGDRSIAEIPTLIENWMRDVNGMSLKDCDLYDRQAFDTFKLQHIYTENLHRDELSWDYHATFEVATALRFLGFDRYGGMPINAFPDATYHNALHDAAIDHLRLIKCLHYEHQ